tara:strand:- start:59 stop:331 length:273 start_codon:yes stop_codon:yes gene_type:complete
MTSYCYDCGNKIKTGHNKKWNKKDAGIDVKVEHIDDVCECEKHLGEYSAYATTLLGQMGSRPFFTKSEVKKIARGEKALKEYAKRRRNKE